MCCYQGASCSVILSLPYKNYCVKDILSESLSFSKKNSFITKSVEQLENKRKKKTLSQNKLQKFIKYSMRVLFWNFGISTALLSWK